ncbi:HAD-like domain-containing protein [Xylariaceae sp. FL0016]|nr:HAD-like domain-containing protein [Xylariaceae sp. FL0016]
MPLHRGFRRLRTNTPTSKGQRPSTPKKTGAGKRDKIVAPSTASGGVPEPSTKYLSIAAQPPLLLPYPRKILVVIDLNGTLLYRPNRKQPKNFVERPYAKTFLSYCIETFTVVIWSSAKPENVNNMCMNLTKPQEHERIAAIWARDKFGLVASDYQQRVQCYKRLTKLWDDPEIQRSHPEYQNGGRWSQNDTILVDDSLEKARSEPYNAISLPEFDGNKNEQGHILPQVHDYINECAQQANISAFMRERPFQLITDFHL